MLRSLKEILGYDLFTYDETLGKVDDYLVDEDSWHIRYAIGEMGNWLNRRKALLSTEVLSRPRWETARLAVNMKKENIQSAPDIDFNSPFTRKGQARLHEHYGWNSYWMTDFNRPTPLPTNIWPEKQVRTIQQEQFVENIPALRSVRKLLDYRVDATDGAAGSVEDLIFDDESWIVRYMAVDTGTFLSSHLVLIAPIWLEGIHSEKEIVRISLPQETIRESPEFDPTAPVNHQYEEVIYDYYGRAKYWL